MAKLNAVAHGLRSVAPVIPGERAKDWNEHRAGMLAALAPIGTLETELAERAALLTWRLRRVTTYESHVTLAALAQIGIDTPDETAPNPFAALLPFRIPEPQNYTSVKKHLDAARANAASFAQTSAQFRRLQVASPDEPLAGGVAFDLLREATGYTPNAAESFTDIEDHEFLESVGVPDEFLDNPEAWGGWTVGCVMAGIVIIAEDDDTTAPEVIERAAQESRKCAAQEERTAARLAVEFAPLEAARVAADRLARAQAVLLDEASLNKLMRYETHLNKQLTQTLHLLERLQAARSGAPLVPPLAVDVLVDAGNTAMNSVE